MTLVLLWNMPGVGVEEKRKPKAPVLARPVSRLRYEPPSRLRYEPPSPSMDRMVAAHSPPVWMALAWEFLNE